MNKFDFNTVLSRSAIIGAVITALLLGAASFAHAQDNRMTFKGQMTVAASPNSPNGVAFRGAVKKPYVAFTARYTHESWMLMGTAVHSCEIIWEYTDYQGRRSPDSVTVVGLDLDLTNPDIRFALENHPAIVRAAQTQSGTPFVEARLSALRVKPTVWDLDFLVPVKNAAGASRTEVFTQRRNRANSDERATLDIGAQAARLAYTRCLSGALGSSGRAGFNTAYAYETDELMVMSGLGYVDNPPRRFQSDGTRVGSFNFLQEDYAKAAFEDLTRFRRHVRTYEASGDDLRLADVETDPTPIINLVNDILREAAGVAEQARKEATQRIEAARQAEQAARREAEDAARAEEARLARERAAAHARQSLQDHKRFNPDRPVTESGTVVKARINDRFAALMEKNNPVQQLEARQKQAASSRVSTASRSMRSSGQSQAVNVRLDASTNNLTMLEVQARSLSAASRSFASYLTSLPRPQRPRDMGVFAPDRVATPASWLLQGARLEFTRARFRKEERTLGTIMADARAFAYVTVVVDEEQRVAMQCKVDYLSGGSFSCPGNIF